MVESTSNTDDSPNPQSSGPLDQQFGDKFARLIAPRQLDDSNKRELWKLDVAPEGRGPYIIELNVQHAEGLPGAANAFRQMFGQVFPQSRPPEETAKPRKRRRGPQSAGAEQPSATPTDDPYKLIQIAKTYFRCEMNVPEWRQLIAVDNERAEERAKDRPERIPAYRSIYRLWPDFPVVAHTDRSMATIKADAALRSFDAAGNGITWAVIDSGIDSSHPHFGDDADDKFSDHTLLNEGTRDLHRCYISRVALVNGLKVVRPPLEDPDLKQDMKREVREELVKAHREAALSDAYGHGTHVAAIIAGHAPPLENVKTRVFDREDRPTSAENKSTHGYVARIATAPCRYRGAAPGCRLISLRVLDERGEGRSSDVIRALEYISERINDNPKLMRVHGVNLSVGYEFDAEMFACGQSPLCSAVNRLVQSGVVVIAAAGNTGYGAVAASARPANVGLSNTINDPGNADLAITVGATHREAPHTYGVSYFSSKGPTGDGRLKPDLVAPGERITSAAAGRRLEEAKASAGVQDGEKFADYIDDSGTSMAAPHVSGAIAAFLSIRREFIGKPLDVKRIFLDSATPLGRERYFEGHGLVDLMRAIQNV